jgi:hypothetical protein
MHVLATNHVELYVTCRSRGRGVGCTCVRAVGYVCGSKRPRNLEIKFRQSLILEKNIGLFTRVI